MYDDDFFSLLNSMSGTTTETEEDTSSQSSTSYQSPQQTYNPYASDSSYSDDYSITPNYEEQQNYNSINQNYGVTESNEPESNTMIVRQMETPMIRKEAPAVNLIKKRQRIELHARMKIVVAMFSIIVAALLFLVTYNFVAANKMRATFASKQAEITALQESILGLRNEYTSLSDDEHVKLKAEGEGFVDQTTENTIIVELKEIYEQNAVEDMPSNWFNDVCDFLSGLFS